MKIPSKTVLFFGNERLATGVTTSAPVVQALLAANYSLKAIVVAQRGSENSRKARELEIEEVAQSQNIPLRSFPSLSQAREELASYGADIGILVAYGKLIPQAIIDLFPGGIVNIHPSLLPEHRGPTPIESTILRGELVSGVSLMQLEREMDAGPVYAQQAIKLRGDETKQALADRLNIIGKDMLITHLPAILSGSLLPRAQNTLKATYDQRIEKSAGIIGPDDWNVAVSQISRQVRAYAGWPRVRTIIGNLPLIITSAHTEEAKGLPGSVVKTTKTLGIYGADGLLCIDRLIPPGKREMSVEAFLAGYHF